MKNFSRVLVALAAFIFLAASCGSSGSLEVEDARYRLSRADLGAGYMTVTNSTDDAVTLQAASAPGVGRIELHESIAADDGTMSMQPRPDGFVIAAGKSITLQPGGMHLMLFDPTGTEDLDLTLDFGDQTLEVSARYDAEASAAAMSDGAMSDMDHGDMEMDEDMDHSDMDMDEDMDHSDMDMEDSDS